MIGHHRIQLACTAALLILAISSSAQAHKPSDSYLRIHGDSEWLTIQWDIAVKDLEFLLGIDANQDLAITWGEVKAKQDDIVAHALSRLRIHADEQDVTLNHSQLMMTQHSDGAYVVLYIDTDAPCSIPALCIDYQLLFDVDPTHRGLVLYENAATVSTHIISPDSGTLVLQTGEQRLATTFITYVREGIWHIWIGLDHILFLLTLLLPAVYGRNERQWIPVQAFRPAWGAVLKIVTMFTLAHSITLWLSVMEYVTLPSKFVEAAIAGSIIVTALNNLYPVLRLSNRSIAFCFGLIHGFGFANVLLDLGLNHVALSISLLGFNVGVELGQLAIVAVFLPIAFLLKSTAFYKWGVFRMGSIAVSLIAVVWMYERVFHAEILGF